MSRTLNQLIESAVLNGEEAEEISPATVETRVEQVVASPASEDFADAEKIASALEFLGRRGIASVFGDHEKIAACAKCGKSHKGGKKCPYCGGMKKKASEQGLGNVGTNMSPKPGLPAPAMGIDTGTAESGSHVPQLASNESAIAYKKSVKAQRTTPALTKLLKTKPYADPKMKEYVSNASAKGDKNIHTKKASANDLDAIRAELARRAAGGK